jgi:hypothetical protein
MARLFQFSIRGLLWAVTFLAVGIAALINANGLWQGAIWGLVLYGLTAAILLAVYRREQTRAFWLGFAVFGWLYLALFLTSLGPAQLQFWTRADPLKHEDLITTRLAYLAHQNLLPPSRRDQQIAVAYPPAQPPGGETGAYNVALGSMPGMGPSAGGSMMSGGGGMMPGAGMPGMPGMPGMTGFGPPGGGTFTMMVTNPNYVPIENFSNIFHALCLLLIAAIGGKTCQLIYRTRPTT